MRLLAFAFTIVFVWTGPDINNSSRHDKDLKSQESVVNIKLQKVCNWLNANKLTVNAKKIKFCPTFLGHHKRSLTIRLI